MIVWTKRYGWVTLLEPTDERRPYDRPSERYTLVYLNDTYQWIIL